MFGTRGTENLTLDREEIVGTLASPLPDGRG
jgi:hypothetical protein